jgi:hypothetical protein
MASNTLRLHAHFTPEYMQAGSAPTHFEFMADLPTVEDAKVFAAQFPKSVKMYAGKILDTNNVTWGWVRTDGNLTSNGVNGGINETALKRYQAVVKAATKLGIEIQYEKNARNSYATREEFETAISAEAK